MRRLLLGCSLICIGCRGGFGVDCRIFRFSGWRDCGHRQLPPHDGFECLGGGVNLLRIARGVGRFQGLGGLQHVAVVRAQRLGGFFALDGLALEGVVNRLAKGVPEFLLLLALDRHALRLVLPALLQRLDGINVQLRLGAQHLGLFNHGLAARQTVVARAGQRCIGGVHRGFPERLDFGKGFFAQMTGFTPLVDKAVEGADVLLPVGVVVGFEVIAPGQHFIDQHAALGLDGFSLFLDGFQPGFDHLVGFVAGVVKTLPQRVVRRAALVAGLPLLAHDAQRVLLLAPAHGLGHQRFGLDDQFFADLVGTPALPPFELAGGRQGGVGGDFELAVDVADVVFERLAQLGGDLGRGFAVAFGDFVLKLGQRLLDDGGRFLAQVFQHGGVEFGLGRTRRLAVSAVVLALGRDDAARRTQLVGPHRHGGQRRSDISAGLDGDADGGLKGVPHRQQLAARSIEQRRKFGVHAGPVGIERELVGLRLPVRHVGTQGVERGLGIAPGLD